VRVFVPLSFLLYTFASSCKNCHLSLPSARFPLTPPTLSSLASPLDPTTWMEYLVTDLYARMCERCGFGSEGREVSPGELMTELVRSLSLSVNGGSARSARSSSLVNDLIESSTRPVRDRVVGQRRFLHPESRGLFPGSPPLLYQEL